MTINESDGTITSGTYVHVITYPSSEISANPNIVQRGDNNTQVFWDNGAINPAN